jgi:sugar lactone lactonase YvrE
LLISEAGTGERPMGGFGLGNHDGRVTLYDMATGTRSVVVEGLSNAVDPGGGVVGANQALWRAGGNASDTVMVALAGGAPEREPRAQILVGEAGGAFAPVADLWAFEAANNPDGGNIDSNPWRMVETAGDIYISDAGGNSVVKMDPATMELSLFAGLDPAGMRENGSPISAVATGLVADPDDANVLYVSLLASFDAGEAQVRRLEDLNGDGDADDDGEDTLYVDGLTTAVDLAVAPDGGLYVLEFGGRTALGTLSRVASGGGTVEVKADNLYAASGLVFTPDGDVLVSVGVEGSGYVTSRVVKLLAEDIGVVPPGPTETPTDPLTPQATDTPATPTTPTTPGPGEYRIYAPDVRNRDQ